MVDGSLQVSRFRDPWWIASVIASVVLVGLVIWPVLEAGRSALNLVWHPTGDWAVLTLRVEDVGSHTPLLGPYSRFGWNHPGPLMYWLLAGPYHLFGNRPESVLAASAFLNALCVASIGAVAWRRGRLPFVALTMGAIALLFHAMGPQMIRDPWNPYITLLPLALFVLLAWSLTEGDWWMLPFAIFVFSFELESHIGYLPILVFVSATTAVIIWRQRSPSTKFPVGKARVALIAVTGLVAIISWLPVLLDQFFGSRNLGAIISYFISPGEAKAGFGSAFHLSALQLALPQAPWLSQQELADSTGAIIGASLSSLFVPLVAMLIAVVIAVRLKLVSPLRLQVLAVAAAFAGFIATAQVVGPLYDWITRWWWVIACLWWLSISWTLFSSLQVVLRTTRNRKITSTVLTAFAFFTTLQSVRPVVAAAHRTAAPNSSASAVLGNFLPQTIATLNESGPVLVRSIGSVRGDYGDGVRYALESNGIQIVAPDDIAYRLGDFRSIANRTPVATVWIVNADTIAEFQRDPTMRYVGMWDPLTEEERKEFFADEVKLQEQFIAAQRLDLAEALTNGTGNVDKDALYLDGIDQELLNRVESARRKGDPVAIFIGPPPPRA